MVERKRKDGSIGYHAQVAIRQAGATHRETTMSGRQGGGQLADREAGA
ncbi:hypothetical protein [Methylobacterium aquaticum]|nr:hypothetical protein [Methylobacterium aquaticum]